MPSNERPTENLQDIRRRLDEAMRELNSLVMKPGESLRDFEYRVKRHSDKLLSLKLAEQVQRQLLEQDARDAEEELKKRIHKFARKIAIPHPGLAERRHPLSRRQRNQNRLPIFCSE